MKVLDLNEKISSLSVFPFLRLYSSFNPYSFKSFISIHFNSNFTSIIFVCHWNLFWKLQQVESDRISTHDSTLLRASQISMIFLVSHESRLDNSPFSLNYFLCLYGRACAAEKKTVFILTITHAALKVNIRCFEFAWSITSRLLPFLYEQWNYAAELKIDHNFTVRDFDCRAVCMWSRSLQKYSQQKAVFNFYIHCDVHNVAVN